MQSRESAAHLEKTCFPKTEPGANATMKIWLVFASGAASQRGGGSVYERWFVMEHTPSAIVL